MKRQMIQSCAEYQLEAGTCRRSQAFKCGQHGRDSSRRDSEPNDLGPPPHAQENWEAALFRKIPRLMLLSLLQSWNHWRARLSQNLHTTSSGSIFLWGGFLSCICSDLLRMRNIYRVQCTVCVSGIESILLTPRRGLHRILHPVAWQMYLSSLLVCESFFSVRLRNQHLACSRYVCGAQVFVCMLFCFSTFVAVPTDTCSLEHGLGPRWIVVSVLHFTCVDLSPPIDRLVKFQSVRVVWLRPVKTITGLFSGQLNSQEENTREKVTQPLCLSGRALHGLLGSTGGRARALEHTLV